jgi:hypothetical protein
MDSLPEDIIIKKWQSPDSHTADSAAGDIKTLIKIIKDLRISKAPTKSTFETNYYIDGYYSLNLDY